MKQARIFLSLFFAVLAVMGCAGVPLTDDLSVPAGKIEGNRFMGVRYSFNFSVPPNWKISTEFPEFLEDLGFDRPSPRDKEQNEVYIVNPETKSSLQIDFTPAGGTGFSQSKIENLTTMATGSFKEELEKEHGKGVQAEVYPTEPFSLKGVQFAAKKYATYTIKGVKREQGWIYGFTEPYQIFILYMILDKDGMKDRRDLKAILDSFEYVPKK